ncbi:hypothetical protein UMM65_16660 [Aureibaculum sp. 2210JD6-5]|uniref:hypothetical protein n=1 Tax=Aureibaculum sp. 2210JD6-5 TaxID=3103957 RepID=UPI002AAEB336|nr:hypothetical protein [Aureibaculum sp. 2210JD6-5]MDY7396880.1 hypothetical protein [Aureibaculum sp. 2210JD6-5]
MPKKEYLLFNTVDEMISNEISNEKFQRHLVKSILFDKKLLVHEANFLNSSRLFEYLDRHEEISLFEKGMRENIITPAYSDSKKTNLEEVYKNMALKYKGRGSGKNLKYEGKVYDSIRHRLFSSSLICEDIGNFKVWPKTNHQGKSFEEIYFNKLNLGLKRMFDTGSTKVIENHYSKKTIKSILKKSKKIELKNNKKIELLERHELYYKFLDYSLGKNNDIAISVDAFLNKSDSRNNEKALNFLRLTSRYHHSALSDLFGSMVNHPAYDFDIDEHINDENGLKHNEISSYPILVGKIPHYDYILNREYDDLMKIRQHGEGRDFFSSYDNYNKKRDDLSLGTLNTAFDNYCKAICRLYDEDGMRVILKYEETKMKRASKEFFVGLGNLAKAASGYEILSNFNFLKDFKNGIHILSGRKKYITNNINITLPPSVKFK